MDIQRLLCDRIGADLFGRVTIRMKDGQVLPFADGSGLVKVRGTVFCRGSYPDMRDVRTALLSSAGQGILRCDTLSPICVHSHTADHTVFSLDFEAVYSGGQI